MIIYLFHICDSDIAKLEDILMAKNKLFAIFGRFVDTAPIVSREDTIKFFVFLVIKIGIFNKKEYAIFYFI